jgi:hypothetical protein
MLKHFRSSPLWLIGLFIIFAQATAGIAAVRIEGWPQAALVIFVIAYSTVVTAVFFTFLWLKPENFYAPSEYSDISPASFASALRRLPDDTANAVANFQSDPRNDEALFALMDNLLSEIDKQHLILMRRNQDRLDVSSRDDEGITHTYEIITRNRSISVGVFSPARFIGKLKGTELIFLSGGHDKLFLSERGQDFADWLIAHEKDAETFQSSVGRWGPRQSVKDMLRNASKVRMSKRGDSQLTEGD